MSYVRYVTERKCMPRDRRDRVAKTFSPSRSRSAIYRSETYQNMNTISNQANKAKLGLFSPHRKLAAIVVFVVIIPGTLRHYISRQGPPLKEPDRVPAPSILPRPNKRR